MTGMYFARELQRVEHGAVVFNLAPCGAHKRELGVEKTNIEISIVDDKLGAADKLDEVRDHFTELWLLAQMLKRDAVDLDRAVIDLTLGVEVSLIAVLGDTSIDDLDTTDLDDAMSQYRFETSGFRVEHDLSHAAVPRDARRQAPTRVVPAPGGCTRRRLSIRAHHFVDRNVGESVHCFVIRVACMPTDPIPLDDVIAAELVQPLPQIDILD